MSDSIYPFHASAAIMMETELRAKADHEWDRAVNACADYAAQLIRRTEASGPTATVVRWEADVDVVAALRRLRRG